MAVATARPWRGQVYPGIWDKPDWLRRIESVAEEPEESVADQSDSTAPRGGDSLEGNGPAELDGGPATVPKLRVRSMSPSYEETSLEEVARFVANLYRLSAVDEHKAVDLVYDYMDDNLIGNRFPDCDTALEVVDTDKLPASAVISILIVTRKAAAQGLLPSRDKFFTRSVKSLSRTRDPKEATRLLGKYQ